MYSGLRNTPLNTENTKMSERKYNQVVFKDKKDRLIGYRFEKDTLFCTNGEQIIKSANHWRKRTAKGENLKVVKVTKSNWKRTAKVHADRLGFFIKLDTLACEKMDLENLPQPEEIDETPMAFIEKGLEFEFGWLH